MANDNLDPVRPGEAPPVPTSGTETLPIPPQTDPASVELAKTTPPPPVEGEAERTAIWNAVDTPTMEASGLSNYAARNRTRATWEESFLASVRSWDLVNVFKGARMPDFEPGNEDINELILNVDTPLSKEELEYLRENSSRSLEEHIFRLKQIQDQRLEAQAMGDNLIVSTLATIADPAWLAVGGAGAFVGAAVKGGKAARFLAGAGADIAGTAVVDHYVSQMRPVSDMERILNFTSGALLGGAGAVMVRRGGRVEPADPNYPARELNDMAQTIPERAVLNDVELRTRPDGSGVDATPTRPRMDTPAGARDIPGSTRETADIPDWDVHYRGMNIPKGATRQTARQAIRQAVNSTDNQLVRQFLRHLESKMGDAADKMPVFTKDGNVVKGRADVKGVYDIGGDRIIRRKDAPEWVLAHELTHGLTVNKLAYGKANPNTKIGSITKELDDLYQQVRDDLLASTDATTRHHGSELDEFVAGLFSGDQNLIDILSKTPTKNNPRRSVAGALVDAVRRLLGIPLEEMNGFLRALNLSDELMDQPLRTIYHRPSGSTYRKVSPDMTREQAAKAAVGEADATFNDAKKASNRFANMISWNFHKTMSKWSEEVADILLDNPLLQNKNSADSWARSIRADFVAKQRVYEDKLQDILKQEGVRWHDQIFNNGKYSAAQMRVEKALQRELDFRNAAGARGDRVRGAPGSTDDIIDLADHYSDAMDTALDELKRSGVFGAEDVAAQYGYYPHRWSTNRLTEVENRLRSLGHSDDAIMKSLRGGFAGALRRANPDWSPEVSESVAKAMVDRMTRRSLGTDANTPGRVGAEHLDTIEDLLEGLPPAQKARVMDTLRGVVDEGGRASYLKSRLNIDTEYLFDLPDGSTFRLGEFLDSDLTNLMEHYLDDAAGRAAFARVGVTSDTELRTLRSKLTQDMRAKNIPDAEIRRAEELFDNAVDLIHGRPVNADFNWGYRMMQAVTQMVGLGAAGIWQVTEYAKLMQTYGVLKSLGMFRRSISFREHFSKFTPDEAGRLENILARNAYQDIRLRPIVRKLEDGIDIPLSNKAILALNAAKQAVPYFNAMKFVQRHQSNLVGNLVTDTLVQGARGRGRARDILKQYGLDLDHPVMGDVLRDVLEHGADTTRWGPDTWDTVRNALNRMVDDSVLRARRGEIPAFAQVSELGRFIFTFRSFVLSAHNKTLAGTINRDGFLGMGLLLAYQFPMSYIAVMANSMRTGRSMDDDELMKSAVAMMGGIGLGSELWGILTGEKQQFGAPGLIAADRLFAAGSAVSSAVFGEGSYGNAAATTMSAIPILPLVVSINHMQNALKDE